MKSFILLLAILLTSTYAYGSEYFFDEINLFSSEDTQQIDNHLAEIKNTKNFEILVFITDTVKGNSIEEDSMKKTNELIKNELGAVTILYLAIKDRMLRIEVGNGVLYEISDDMALEIVNKLIPHLKNEEYKKAILMYIDAIYSLIKDYTWSPEDKDLRDISSDDINKIFLLNITTDNKSLTYDEELLNVNVKNKNIILNYSEYQRYMLRRFLIDNKRFKNVFIKKRYKICFRVKNVKDDRIIGNLMVLYPSSS